MKMFCVLFTITVLPAAAMAQDRSREPLPKGVNSKAMDSCKTDVQKFCVTADLKQECLVAHWTKISNDCQDALATPMRNGGDGGG